MDTTSTATETTATVDYCDCCKTNPGEFLRGGDWLCPPCESYNGTRAAR